MEGGVAGVPWRGDGQVSGEVRDGARRAGLAAAAVGVVAAGLVVTRAGSGPFVGAVGDALYAVLSYLLVGLALPRARAWVVAGVALGACTLIELLQLTGLPAIHASSAFAETEPQR